MSFKKIEYVPVALQINERRAPTDESIKLLREMERLAREEVLKAVKVEDTNFTCVIQGVDDPVHDTFKLRAVYSLNGFKMSSEVSGCAFYIDHDDPFGKLREAMAKQIAGTILSEALRNTTRSRFDFLFKKKP